MRLLTAVDQLFLLLESRKQPMHVGGLFLFELPENAESDFVYQLVKQMQDSDVPPSFPFNQVLENLIFWKKDKNFDVEHHLHHVALPNPGRVRELLMYVSREHGRLLDRAMPLWECHVIEGIEPEVEGGPERFAWYFKIHHSLVDGVAAMRLVQKITVAITNRARDSASLVADGAPSHPSPCHSACQKIYQAHFERASIHHQACLYRAAR